MWKAWFCLFRGKGGISFYTVSDSILHLSEDLAWYTIIIMLPKEHFACPEAFRTIEYKGRKILVIYHIIFNKAGKDKHVKLSLVICSTM